MTAESGAVADPYGYTGVPQFGFRNYWYPVLAGWRLRKKPKAVKILGDDIVVYRDGGKLYALADRCPHRGARLSQGVCLYPGSGTISCPYHAWTFAGDSGECVAKIMEGPGAPMARHSGVKSYPVREFRGAIWVFVGDMEAVPLEDDLPECLAEPGTWHGYSSWRTYRCNWRILKDNLCHDLHAPFLHRNAPELMFQPIFPFASRVTATPFDDKKGIGYSARDGISQADFPGLGHFPTRKESWYRFMKPVGRGREVGANAPAIAKYGYKFRQSSLLPGVTLIGRPSGDYFTCRWVTPVDENTTLYYAFSMFRRQGRLKQIANGFVWAFWLSWLHDWLFSEQDKRILEKVIPGKELLSRSDIGVAAWRRFAVANARRPPAANEAGDEQATAPPAAAAAE